jgi:hypothetical protein
MTTRPTFNHVAFSMDASLLDERGRADILAFYGDVFGWTEGDNQDEEGNPLILYTGAFGQFVYLLPSTTPLTAPPLDHFGLQVGSLDELHAIVDAARRWAERDQRVRIIDVHHRTTHGPSRDYTLTSAYIRFLLPLQVEVQHLQAHPQ